jgi:Uma2 family endonuclease
MASAANRPCLSVEEYLNTTYRPDVDYVDGHIKKRNLGEFDHGMLQFKLMEFFHRHREEWKIRAALDTRTQVGPTRFRVPHVCITDATKPKEQILRAVPILCIEVLSPKDTMRKMRARSEDYFHMGVPVVWILNPRLRNITICLPGGVATSHKAGVVTVDGTPIAVDFREIYSALDED